MRALVVLITVCISANAFAQSPPPRAAKSQAQSKPQTPMGCKLVGTVRGTKFGPENARIPRDLEVPPPRPKPPRHRYLSKRLAQFQPVKSNNFPSGFRACRAGAEGEAKRLIDIFRY